MTSSSKKANPPIAVCGVSALFPGSVDATGFWRNILAGKDLITDVPASHWLIDDYYDPNPAAPDKTYAKRGAFLPDVDFDPLAFGVPPSVVPATDTSQLLALIVAQKVLEDASRGDFSKLDRSRISVILGVTSAQELLASMVSRLQRPIWVKALRESGVPEEEVVGICDKIAANYVPWQESSFPGLLGNVVAGRIANRFDLGGTNCITDAACASTFSAMSMAVNELYLGQSDMVVTGGVDTLNDIFMFMCFSKTPALSLKGDCRPFSDAADGTMLGEGLGMVALRRLEDAERDGNPIYAVLKSVGTGSDGRAKSVYAPLPEGQARALRRAYDTAGHGPETVELVEAHGTATKAGDAAEFEGLRQVFGTASDEKQWCALGSVKSQIGHTKAAAGAAGLFKAVMALHHKVLPPTIKVDKPNPKLAIETSPFYLNTRARPWVRGADHPRRASVSSFGFGGSNFHLALEEHNGPSKAGRLPTRSHELVALGADSKASLSSAAKALAGQVQDNLPWTAKESQRRFDPKAAHRLVVIAAEAGELTKKLEEAAIALLGATDPMIPGVHYGAGDPGKLAFLFPGQGSQSIDMGAELAMNFNAAIGVWDRVASLGLHDKVFPISVFDERALEQQALELRKTEWAQPSIGATSASMLAVLADLGVKPALAGGHSFGEISALFAAGAIGERDFLGIAKMRGSLMAEAGSTPGGMSAVNASRSVVEALLGDLRSAAVIANHNGPAQVVISGPLPAIEQAEKALSQKTITFTRLPVSTAFHSAIVSASSAPFKTFLDGVEIKPPSFPVYANTTATTYASDAGAIRAGLAEQIAKPVRFVEQVENMHGAGARIFLEVGPGTVLTGLVGRILDGKPHVAVSIDDKRGGVLGLMNALGKLAALGVPMQLDGLWADIALEDPSKKLKAKMALPLNGSNYGRPYPPPGGPEALPPPNPPRPLPEPQIVMVEAPANNHAMNGNGASHAPSTNGSADMANEPSYGPSADWLRVFEETQRQTAEAHQVFQRTMAETHRAFLEAMTGGLERSAGASSVAPMLPSHANGNGHTHLLPASFTASHERARPTSNGNGHGHDSHAHAHVPVVAMPATSAARPAVVAKPVVVPVVAKAPAPVVAKAPVAKPNVDLRATLFAIVAEKTGYPVEALGPTMDLEGDLGIDSIKRVEILSALREKAPGLPEVSADSLGKLRTLEQIASFLGESTPVATPVAAATIAAPAVSAAAPKAGALNLELILKEVVAEKTGYPVEALRPELDLESDLGIDSIKRVEILSRMRERAPGLPEVSMETMAKLRTLGQIAAQLGGDAKPVTATQPAVVSTLPNLGRWSVESIHTPALGLVQPLVKKAAKIGITDDGTGVRAALIAALRERGVAAEADDGKLDASVVFDLAGLGDVKDLLAFQKAALMRAKAFATSGIEGRAYHLIFDAGGDLGASGHDRARAGVGGLTGLAKTAALEWPKSLVRAIDVARGGRSIAELAEIIADEVLFGGPEVEIGLGANGRRTRLVSKKSATGLPPTGAPRLGDKSVHVISGGGRGVTRAIAQGLAERYRGRFVLLGRTPLGVEAPNLAKAKTERELMGLLAAVNAGTPPLELKKKAAAVLAAREIRDTLKALEAKGASAQYLAVDVRDAGAVAKALDQVRQSWGPIQSVIHAAGVIEDRMIADKTEAQADRVLGTKIEGLTALLAATADDPLSVIALFGSISGRTGNVGQSDYAMANETLVKIARAEKTRRGATCVVKAIAWGPWQGGMVTPAHEELFKQRGVPLIDLDSGARLFLEEIERPDGVEVVIGCSPINHQPIAIDFVIDQKTHGYLESHSIKGVPVVPVMLAMEWFVRAARAYKPELELARLTNLKVMRGARIEKLGEGHALRLLVKELANGGPESTLGLELRGPAGELHYSAEATMSPLLPTPAPTPASPKVDAWGARSIYGGVLFHGPRFQAIRSVRGVSEDGGEATLAGMGQLGWPGDPAWRTDCAVLDGGLQLALLWSERVLGRASLPTSIKSARLFQGALDGDVRCLLKGTGHQAERASADLVFVGADGRIVAELEGVETHALPSDA